MPLPLLAPETHTAQEVVRLLGLAPLAGEGGWFRRVGESDLLYTENGRRACSSIYFLITPEGFSALHRLDAVETWCFHAGDPLEMLVLAHGGEGRCVTLGTDLMIGQHPHWMVAAGAWQGARLRPGGRWALVTCVVAPEFLPEGFQLGERAQLAALYPKFAAEIAALTR